MKRNFLLLFSMILLSAGTLFAQNILIYHHGTAVPNDGDIYVWGDFNSLIEVHLAVKNNTSSVMDIKVKKIEQSIIAGSMNYFCWTECYAPFIFLTPDSMRFPAGHTDSVSFTADYMALGNAGTSEVSYVFFNNNNPNDSTSVNIHFYGSPTGIINPTLSKAGISNAFPNPARNTISLDYTLPADAASAHILIRDIVGSTLKQTNLNGLNGKAVINIEDLNSGIYFYSLIVNNEVIATRKLIVRR